MKVLSEILSPFLKKFMWTKQKKGKIFEGLQKVQILRFPSFAFAFRHQSVKSRKNHAIFNKCPKRQTFICTISK